MDGDLKLCDILKAAGHRQSRHYGGGGTRLRVFLGSGQHRGAYLRPSRGDK